MKAKAANKDVWRRLAYRPKNFFLVKIKQTSLETRRDVTRRDVLRRIIRIRVRGFFSILLIKSNLLYIRRKNLGFVVTVYKAAFLLFHNDTFWRPGEALYNFITLLAITQLLGACNIVSPVCFQ